MTDQSHRNPAPVADVCLVLPVRNRPEHLACALESVFLSTIQPAQWILVFDGNPYEQAQDRASFDRWRSSKPEGFFQEGSNLELIFSDGCGPAKARNLGVAKCNCKWIAFLDSDDLWKKEKLELQLDYLARRPYLKGAQTQETWVLDGKTIAQKQNLIPGPGAILLESFERCLVALSALVISREVFLNLGGFHEDYPVCEDYEFFLRYFDSFSLGLIPQPLTIKQAGNWHQLSRSNHSLDYYRCKAMIQFVAEKAPSAEIKQEIKKVFLEKKRILETGAKKRGSFSPMSQLNQRIVLQDDQ